MDLSLIPDLLAGSPSADHEHGWQTESAHATSQGCVVYVRCAACGARRVDLQLGQAAPPVAVSRVIARTERVSATGRAAR